MNEPGRYRDDAKPRYRIRAVYAAVLIAAFAVPIVLSNTAAVHTMLSRTALFHTALLHKTLFATALAQNSTFVAPGRIEGAGPVMAIGVAAAGIVEEVSVLEGSHVQAGQTLIQLNCQPTAAEVRTRKAQLDAAQALSDRARNGSRPDEIAVGEAVVRYSQARAEEAQKTQDRTLALQEGVTVTTARILEAKRDARIAAAQLEEARARLSLLRAGSREEDIRRTQALRDAAAADLESAQSRLDQCTVRAPAAGIVTDVLANKGQYFSLAVPQPLLHLVQDGPPRIRADVNVRDAARVCASQAATIASEALPNGRTRARVASISPTANDNNVVAVILDMASGTPALPIGSGVTVTFDPCPPKT